MQKTLPAFHSLRAAQMGAVLAFLAVALGAFGAHGLKDLVSPERLATFETAVRYQMYHALALLLIAVLPQELGRAALPLFWGVLIFSGSLYLLVATGFAWFGAVAPIGGGLMLLGWALLSYYLFRLKVKSG